MRLLLSAAVIFLIPQICVAQTQADCGQPAFAAAVGDASAVLSAMNDENKKAFQAKLMALKAREGWTDGDYAAKATPFVKDATISALDDGNKTLLAKVPQLGGFAQAGSIPSMADESRRCAMLNELRGLMARVVENTRAKWTHMLGKLDSALDVSRQAKAATQ
jgi:altronate dehydratase